MIISPQLVSVLITSVSFLLVFAAFQPASIASVSPCFFHISSIQKNVLEAAANETKTDVGNGYISLSLLYTSFSISTWFAPVIAVIFGLRLTMCIGAFCYVLFIVAFFEPRAWFVYLTSLANGFGAAIMWTAQGSFISLCSTDENSNRHFSMFWGILQLSQVIGGLYSFFTLSKMTTISRDARIRMYAGFTAFASFGSLMFLTLYYPKLRRDVDSKNRQTTPSTTGEIMRKSAKAFRRSFVLIVNPKVIAVLLAAAFTGVHISFYSSVYPTCLGHTLAFGADAKSFLGLAGVFTGLGEVIGSLLMMTRRWINPDGLVLLFGFIPGVSAIVLLWLMLPVDSPLADTSASTYIQPNGYLAMFICILLGNVDCVWNTRISDLMSSMFKHSPGDTASAFALFRCLQSILAAVAFGYSTELVLHYQVALYIGLISIGLLGFVYAHYSQVRRSSLLPDAPVSDGQASPDDALSQIDDDGTGDHHITTA